MQGGEEAENYRAIHRSNRKFKVALVAPCPFPFIQGSQVYIEEMAEALHKRGHEIHLVTYHLSYGDEGHLPFRIHRIGRIPFYRKLRAGPHLLKSMADTLLIKKVLEIVKSFRIEIIHAHNYESPFCALPSRLFYKVPVIYNSHGLLCNELSTYFHWFPTSFIERGGRIIDTLIAKISDRVLTISEESTSFYKRVAGENRVDFVPPAIDIERIDRIALGCESKMSSDPPLAVYAGNLDRYQNIEGLFKAFGKVVSIMPKAKLLIASQSSLDEWKGLISRFLPGNNLIYHRVNSFKEMAISIMRARVALNPRRMRGGFPIKNLTYSAFSRPIVCFEGGSSGVIDGETGAVLKDRDEEGFASATIRYMKDESLSLFHGKCGRRLVEKNHNWEKVVLMIEDIYGKMIESRPSLIRI